VLEKCGFVKEGIFRKSIYKDKCLWDEVRFAKLNPDWIDNEGTFAK
jgi:RimJ/RimL family protein N-acetyltransferase